MFYLCLLFITILYVLFTYICLFNVVFLLTCWNVWFCKQTHSTKIYEHIMVFPEEFRAPKVCFGPGAEHVLVELGRVQLEQTFLFKVLL